MLTQLVSAATLASVNPFLPLYLIDLGEDQAHAIVWAGAISAVTNVVQVFAIPLWGAVADRFGRKPMVLRAVLGIGIVMAALVAAQSAWHVFVIRLVQGAVGAPNAALLAMASSILPAAQLGAGMGMLQTMQFLGVSTGPLVGGLAAARFGFRGAFLVAAGAALLNVVIIQFLIHEPARPSAKLEARPSMAASLALGWQRRPWRNAILAMLGYQTAYTLGWVLLPLQISNAVGDTEAVVAVAWVVTANAVGIASGSLALGWLAGRLGSRRVSLLSLAIAGLLTIPLALAQSTLSFAALRLVLGFCIGGVLPALRSAIGEAVQGPADQANLGAVYGLSASAQSAASVIGAPLASLLATLSGFGALQVASAALLVGTAAWYALATPRPGYLDTSKLQV